MHARLRRDGDGQVGAVPHRVRPEVDVHAEVAGLRVGEQDLPVQPAGAGVPLEPGQLPAVQHEAVLGPQPLGQPAGVRPGPDVQVEVAEVAVGHLVVPLPRGHPLDHAHPDAELLAGRPDHAEGDRQLGPGAGQLVQVGPEQLQAVPGGRGGRPLPQPLGREHPDLVPPVEPGRRLRAEPLDRGHRLVQGVPRADRARAQHHQRRVGGHGCRPSVLRAQKSRAADTQPAGASGSRSRIVSSLQ